ncbi:MAG TPA: Rrf2 family transcriptional regulator [Planctomycetota bacterium]|nr:Rrf2 family transcriptional regulator [Planctomycetota bacterium]
MLLNLTAVYGLRAMATLAGLGPGDSLNAAQLSERTHVPQQYLSKVMRKLVVAKLVRGRRGHGGGFSLQRPPRSIRIADVLKAIDVDLGMGCAFGFPSCDASNPCSLHPIWSQLQSTLEAWTGDFTLGDLAPERAGRRRAGS